MSHEKPGVCLCLPDAVVLTTLIHPLCDVCGRRVRRCSLWVNLTWWVNGDLVEQAPREDAVRQRRRQNQTSGFPNSRLFSSNSHPILRSRLRSSLTLCLLVTAQDSGNCQIGYNLADPQTGFQCLVHVCSRAPRLPPPETMDLALHLCSMTRVPLSNFLHRRFDSVVLIPRQIAARFRPISRFIPRSSICGQLIPGPCPSKW
jgi:hypothetical protein